MPTFNPLNMTGRTILVTGASSGLGRETAIYLSRLGARIVLCGRDLARLEQTSAAMEAGEHVLAPFDLTAMDDIPRWMLELTEKTGPWHGLVHSAGVAGPKPIRIAAKKDFDNLMQINVGAAVALSRGFRQKAVFSPGSSIVFLSSVAGLVGQPANALYSATKGALLALARSLALELARENIRVNCVAPAMVMTEMGQKLRQTLTAENWAAIEAMHPLGMGQPEDVAGAIAFLLAPTGRWITGTTIVTDGGYTAA